MKRIRKTPIISIKNKHLMNILDNDYFIELGDVPIKIMNKIIKRKKIYVNDLIDHDITSNGLGKIGNLDNDIKFQFDFIKMVNQKSSSLRFFLTCGVAKYYNEEGHELFVPIVLIPIQYNYRNSLISYIDEMALNNLFIAKIKKIVENNIESVRENFINRGKSKEETEYRDLLEQINSLRPERIESILDIDNLCIKLNNILKKVFKTDEDLIGTTNYLTLVDVEEITHQFEFNFNIQRSKFESTAANIIKNFYNNVNAISRTNIDQKYVLVKTHNGESFCINGKYASGKTSTAINIMADAVLHNKTVLYVNHNLDALNEVRYRLSKLGLNHLWVDLSSNVTELDNISYDDLFKVHSIDWEIVNNIEKYNDIYSQKYHGFTYGYILRMVTERQLLGYNDNLKIENDLEKEEVKQVCAQLDEIEKNLQLVDAYPNNIWYNISSSKTAPDAETTINYTIEFLNQTNEAVNILNKFCDEFKLRMIESHHDLFELNEEINSFMNVKPIEKWIDTNFFKNANTALTEITEAENASYKALSYYENNLVSGYKPGSVELLLKKIVSTHYDVATDTKYINHILENNNDFNEFNSSVIETVGRIHYLSKAISKYFNFSVHNDLEYDLYKKLLVYASRNYFVEEWLMNLQSPNSVITSKYEDVSKLIIEAEEQLKLIGKYVKNINLDFNPLRTILPFKKGHRIDEKYYNKINGKMYRIDGKTVSIDDVKQMVTHFVELGEKIITIIPRSMDIDVTSVDAWRKYLDFCHFANGLNHEQLKVFNEFINNKYHFLDFNTEILPILKDLDIYRDNTNDLMNQFEYYHIPVNGDGLLAIIQSMEEFLNYFAIVVSSKEELYQLVKNDNDNITCEMLFSIIEFDVKYLNGLAVLGKNEKNYLTYFGDSYKGFDTNVPEVLSAVNHFESFKERFINVEDLRSLLNNEDKINHIKDYLVPFADIYQNWYEALKKFSSSFYRGQMSLQLESFKKVLEIINKYYDKIDQVEPSLKIEKDLELFYDLKLPSIPDAIHSGEYHQNLSDIFYHSIINKYYHDMFDDDKNKKKKYEKFDVDTFLKYAHDYNEDEEAYCNQNIKRLRMLTANAIKKNIKNVLRIDNYKPISLADTETINTLNDLSMYDIVIVDDAHLGLSNLYYPVFKANQYVILGDVKFNPSYVNALFNRLNVPSYVKLPKRYIRLTQEFGNNRSESNKFIYDINPATILEKVSSLDEFCDNVCNYYNDYEAKINIVVDGISSLRAIYSKMIEIFSTSYEVESIREIFNKDISFSIVDLSDAKSADINCIYFDPFMGKEDLIKQLFKHYLLSCKVLINYSADPNGQDMQEYMKKHIGKIDLNTYSDQEIYKIIYRDLVKRGITDIDISNSVIKLNIKKNGKMMGIVIFGEDNAVRYSYIDDYQYYIAEYEKFGWKIIALSMENLHDNYQSWINKIVKEYEVL